MLADDKIKMGLFGPMQKYLTQNWSCCFSTGSHECEHGSHVTK
jgi:hypothetical protein